MLPTVQVWLLWTSWLSEDSPSPERWSLMPNVCLRVFCYSYEVAGPSWSLLFD